MMEVLKHVAGTVPAATQSKIAETTPRTQTSSGQSAKVVDANDEFEVLEIDEQ